MSKIFSKRKHAQLYAAFRPRYPDALYNTVLQYLEDGGGQCDLALDLGCGNGQATLELAKHFNHVIGSDLSAAQIAAAPTDNSKVTFRVSAAEDMSYCADSSVDLINCAASIHWYNLEDFYAEARRVLKPNGVLAVYCYSAHPLLDAPEATELVHQVANEDLVGYWNDNDQIVFNNYRSIELPFRDFTRVDDIPMEAQWPLEHFVNFLRTWTAYHLYMKNNPESTIMEDLHNNLKTILDDHDAVNISWPLFLLLSRK